MGNPNCCFMIIAETFFFSSQSPRGTVSYDTFEISIILLHSLCLGVDMNLSSKHRPRFYNIKEPFLSKNYTTSYDTFEISIILLPSQRSAVFCLGVDTNFLLYKHRFRFYNIKEPANSLAPC